MCFFGTNGTGWNKNFHLQVMVVARGGGVVTTQKSTRRGWKPWVMVRILVMVEQGLHLGVWT